MSTLRILVLSIWLWILKAILPITHLHIGINKQVLCIITQYHAFVVMVRYNGYWLWIVTQHHVHKIGKMKPQSRYLLRPYGPIDG